MGDANKFLDENSGGSGYPAIKFQEVGDKVSGIIVDEPKTVTRKSLNDGSPEEQLPINVDTGGNGDASDYRTVWVRAGFLAGAIKEAVKESGGNGLQVGGKLGVQMTELRDTGKPQPAKVFKAKYEPPAKAGVDLDEIF